MYGQGLKVAAFAAKHVQMAAESKQVVAADVEEEEEEEEEDLEPLLKYKRLGAALPAEDATDGISSACSRGKLIVLGMLSGAVWCLDAHSSSGTRSKSKPHTSTVNAVSVDSGCEFYASASDDGTVVVTNIATGEADKFTYTRPILALAMHPQYKATRQHVCGGKAGALTLNSKGWFTSKDTLLHQGEGSITAIAWQGAFIAWSNGMGVKVIDCNSQQHITFIDRPNEDAVKAGACRCSLLWSAPDTLVVAWGTLIKIARVRNRDAAPKADAAQLPSRYCEITAILQTEFVLCGVAPLGKHIVALGWADDEDDEDGEESSEQEASPRPELHVLDMDSEVRARSARARQATRSLPLPFRFLALMRFLFAAAAACQPSTCRCLIPPTYSVLILFSLSPSPSPAPFASLLTPFPAISSATSRASLCFSSWRLQTLSWLRPGIATTTSRGCCSAVGWRRP
jgi:hypothetical protein